MRDLVPHESLRASVYADFRKDGDFAMADVWLIALSVAFFALAFAFAAWLDRI
jgi:hypothetical protein